MATATAGPRGKPPRGFMYWFFRNASSWTIWVVHDLWGLILLLSQPSLSHLHQQYAKPANGGARQSTECLSEPRSFALVICFFARSHAVLPQFARQAHCLVSTGGVNGDGDAETPATS